MLAIAHRQAGEYPQNFGVPLCPENGGVAPEPGLVEGPFMREDLVAINGYDDATVRPQGGELALSFLGVKPADAPLLSVNRRCGQR